MGSKADRQQRLLLLLSKRQDYVTSDELAEFLGLSQKTIYRLIKKLTMSMLQGI